MPIGLSKDLEQKIAKDAKKVQTTSCLTLCVLRELLFFIQVLQSRWDMEHESAISKCCHALPHSGLSETFQNLNAAFQH